jgi:N-acetylglucosamine-6-phosphate deacetylase
MLALTATRLLTPLECIERPVVLIEGETLLEIFSQSERPVPQGRVVDFGDAILVPGFVDIHIHGAAGHDVMNADKAGLAALECLLAAHGVTSYFPTTVTAAIDQTLSALDRLASMIEHAESRPTENDRRAQPLGIHLEGPFISHTLRGVHPPAYLQPPSLDLFDRFWQAAAGRIRLMTIAPELDGAIEVISEATRRGVGISLGHTDADLETARAAVAAGARHATHTFNAMRPLNHRDPGIIGAVLTDSRLSADIIADGIHLHPAIVDLFLKAKGHDLAVLITDSTAATGMPDGRYRLGGIEVEVKDGRCMAGDKLAGSVLTMDRAVHNVMQFAHWNLQDAVRPATLNPARVTRLTQRGKLEAGCVADIAVLNSRGEVKTTIVRGAVPNAAAQA